MDILGIDVKKAFNFYWNRSDKWKILLKWSLISFPIVLVIVGPLLAFFVLFTLETSTLLYTMLGLVTFIAFLVIFVFGLYIRGAMLEKYIEIKKYDCKQIIKDSRIVMGFKYFIGLLKYTIVSFFLMLLGAAFTILPFIFFDPEQNNFVAIFLISLVIGMLIIILDYVYILWIYSLQPLFFDTVCRHGYTKLADTSYISTNFKKYKKMLLKGAVAMFLVQMVVQFAANFISNTIILMPLGIGMIYVYVVYMQPHMMAQITDIMDEEN